MYGAYLQELLRPLGLYDVDSGAGAEELLAVGAAMDRIFDDLEAAEREALLLTAEETGLDAYEAALPFSPEASTAQERRQAIAALLRIDQCAFTVADLNATAAGCGMVVSIREGSAAQTVEVSFPGVRGQPDNFAALQSRLEQILPCHLGIEYVFAFLLWQDLEADYRSWTAVEALGTWGDLERA